MKERLSMGSMMNTPFVYSLRIVLVVPTKELFPAEALARVAAAVKESKQATSIQYLSPTNRLESNEK